MQVSDIISIFTLSVTVAGFYITYKLMKKEYSLAIINEKNILAANELKEALNHAYDLLISYMEYTVRKDEASLKRFHKMREKIQLLVVRHGSNNTMKIWSYFSYNLMPEDGSDFMIHENSNYYIIAVLLLLIVQLKYDIYGLKISTKYIFLTLFGNDILKGNEELFRNVMDYNNELIEKLGLDHCYIENRNRADIWC